MTSAPPAAPPGFDLHAVLDEAALSTDRLLADARGLSAEELSEPSRLPGWTRAHVLTHLARSAEGTSNLVRWANTGEETPMYPSREARNADIEAGARRPAAQVHADVERASQQVLADLATLSAAAYERRVRLGSGAPAYGWELPYVRIRELEVHHVDLAVGYTPAHWSPEFAVRTLDQLAEFFRTEREVPVLALHGTETDRLWQVGARGPVLHGQESGLLAWLIGRSDGDGLTAEPHAPIPPAPTWA